MERSTVYLIVGILVWLQAQAQPDTLWTKVLVNDGFDEECRSIAEYDSGRYFVASNRLTGLRDTDLQLRLISDSGDVYFSRDIDYEDHQHCFELLRQPGQGFTVIGSATDGSLTPDRDVLFMRLDADGDSLHTVIHEAVDNDRLLTAVANDSFGFAAAGYTESIGAGGEDFYFMRSPSATEVTNEHAYGGEDDDRCNAMVELPDGGYVLAGWTRSFAQVTKDAWLVRVSYTGDSLWSRSLGGQGTQECNAMVRDSATGDLILAGHSNAQFWLMRTDSLGEPRWSRTYPGVQSYALLQTADGGFLMAGQTLYQSSNYKGFIVRTDANGNLLWQKTLGGSGHSNFYDAVQTSDYGYLLAGMIERPDEHSWIVRLAPEESPVLTIVAESSEQVKLSLLVPVPGSYRLFATQDQNPSMPAGSEDWYLVRNLEAGSAGVYEWIEQVGALTYLQYSVVPMSGL